MNNNPSIFEINTIVFLRRFNEHANLSIVPLDYWNDLIKKGFDYIWLMGVWKTCDSVINKYCFEDELIKSYKKALKDWNPKDVIGSPFSIDDYEVNSSIGNEESLLHVKSYLNRNGAGLILDLVPNHFSADSRLIKERPGIFLQVNAELFESDRHTYYQPSEGEEKFFAHGRDPFYSAWQDTIQVNFFSEEARDYITNVLIKLTKICDGVRCDMAMLALNNVFKNTWSGVLSKLSVEALKEEFWKVVISNVKKVRADFLFIAEVYWDLERELQQLGFDYTYDKTFTDKLRFGTVGEIQDHLLAEYEYQKKSLRFIENHDEERAVIALGKEKSKAAAIIIGTIPGMRFYHYGQFEGKKIKLPVQLGREPEEAPLNGMKDFYEKLLSITSQEIFKSGNWWLVKLESSWSGNLSYRNILAWQWKWRNEKCIVVINYSDSISTCRLKLDVRGYPEEFQISDLLNDQVYTRSAEEVYHDGLYIELKPWNAHIFKY